VSAEAGFVLVVFFLGVIVGVVIERRDPSR
jgi:hypothetical protein